MANRWKGLFSWLWSAALRLAEKIWGDQIFAWIKPMIPAEFASLTNVVEWAWKWGIPLALLLLGIFFFVRDKQAKSVPDKAKRLGANQSTPPQGDLAQRATEIACRINTVASKYPLMMPDDPEYQRIGRGKNDAAEEAYMREYRQEIATEVQRVFAEAIKRDLMDDLDRMYAKDSVIARRGVEEIGRALMRIAANTAAGRKSSLLDLKSPSDEPFAIAHLAIGNSGT